MERPEGTTIPSSEHEIRKPPLLQKLRLALWKRSPAEAFNVLVEIDQKLFPQDGDLRTLRQDPDVIRETVSSIGGAMDTAFEKLPVNFPFVLSDKVSRISLKSRRRKRLRAYLVTENEEVKKRWNELVQ